MSTKETYDLAILATQSDRRADGGESSISEVITNLKSTSTLVLTNKETSTSRLWREKGITVITHPFQKYLKVDGLRRARELVRSNYYAFKLIRRVSPKVVHTNDRAAFRGCGIGARFAGVPVVNNVRDTHPKMRGRRRAKTLLEFALSEVVLTLSQEMCECWAETLRYDAFPLSLRRFFLEKMTYIYSIVDPDRFHPLDGGQKEVRRDLEVGGAPLLVYVASFHPKKRQLAFIQNALPDLVDQHPETTVAFVGDFVPSQNDQAHACQRAVEALGLNNNVRFTGYRDDVERWYQAADLTVLASEKEGLPRSMIESLACGTPVVSFDVASASEILEGHNCGLVVPQGNYRELRTGIIELWEDDSLRTTMGRQGTTTARTLFSPGTVARQYQTLYQRIATR